MKQCIINAEPTSIHVHLLALQGFWASGQELCQPCCSAKLACLHLLLRRNQDVITMACGALLTSVLKPEQSMLLNGYTAQFGMFLHSSTTCMKSFDWMLPPTDTVEPLFPISWYLLASL